MKIAVLQVRAGTDQAKNIRAGLRWCDQAKAGGADLLLFPECFITGYHLPITNDAAIEPDGPEIRAFQDWARENRMGMVVTAFCKGKKAPRNTAFVIGRDGTVLMRYDKVHTCDYSLESCLESGEEFRVCEFDGVKLGVMICYDREYPESARILMLKGAELVLVPNDCDAMRPRLNALSTRAYENMVGVVMANPPGECAGNSCAFSPECWDANGKCVENTIFIVGERDEGLLYADFDLDQLRSYRAGEMLGNTFRKVHAYGELLNSEVRPPFLRLRGDDPDTPDAV